MIALYEDQRELIAETRKLWPENKRFVIYLPTGGGKTRCAAFIINGLNVKGMRVVFTVPRLSLLNQTLKSFISLGIDATVMHRDYEFSSSAKCVISTTQTLERRGFIDADLYIVDEAHKRSKLFLDLIDSNKDQRVIGLTATPFPAWMGEYFTDMATGKSMRWLIDNGRLSDYDVYAPNIPDLTDVGTRRDANGDTDYVDSKLAEAMGDAKLVGSVVESWLELGENRPTIALCVNVAHANEMANRFEACGISVAVITAKTKNRQPVFDRFESGEIKILLAVDTLTEGADFPFCSCLINARPTKSLCRYVQGLGRVLRYVEGKRALIIDHSGDILRPSLGYPCGITVESLNTGDDGKKQNTNKITREEYELLPKKCAKCHMVKPAGLSQCPACGFIPRAGHDVESAEDIGLKLITRNGGPEKLKKITMAEKQQFYSELLGYKRQRSQAGKAASDGYISNLYKNKFGVWPRGLTSKEAAPSIDTLNYIKSRQIAYAKSRNKTG